MGKGFSGGQGQGVSGGKTRCSRQRQRRGSGQQGGPGAAWGRPEQDRRQVCAKQRLSKSSVHRKPLESMLKHTSLGPTPEILAQTSEVGSENVHFSQVSGGADAAGPGTTL